MGIICPLNLLRLTYTFKQAEVLLAKAEHKIKLSSYTQDKYCRSEIPAVGEVFTADH
jgi:hypothetical protein